MRYMLLHVKKVYKSVGGGGVFSFWLLAVNPAAQAFPPPC